MNTAAERLLSCDLLVIKPSCLVASAVLLVICVDAASAYDTGAMSCDDIGQYAASVVEGKHNGRTLPQQLASIDRIVPSGFATERKIFRTIVRQIYTAPFAKHLSPDGAFAAYKAECTAQQ